MKDKTTNKESNYFGTIVSISSVLLVTGAASALLSHHAFTQISSLVHIALGILLSLLLLPYIYLHFKRIYGVRRLATFTSGLCAMAVLIIMIVSGWMLIKSGEVSTSALTLTIHISSSLIFIGISILHVLVHFVTWSQHRKTELGKFSSTGKIAMAAKLVAAVTVAIYLSFGVANYVTDTPYSTEPIVQDYQYLYGAHPFAPSQTETKNNQFIDERALMTSKKCADCHAEIVQQWEASAHRQAASDRAYVTNITLLAETKGIAATRYCEGCHAPVALLTGQLSEGGLHGGIPESPGNLVGVNCQSCHGISQLVHTKGVASYKFSINQAYLFETANSRLLQGLNRLAIKHNSTQHKQDMLSAVQKTSQVCASCHAQFMDKDLNDWGWVKMQDEYSAWLDSPFAGNSDPQFAHTTRQRCQDCHMPKVNSNDPAADAQGKVRDHRFIGANTMLTTLSGDRDMFTATQRFLQSNKVRISIEPPHRSDATVNKMPINSDAMQGVLQPYYWYKGEQASINVIVANVGVGHNFPGGTIDINQAWVAFQVVDANGRIVYTSGAVDNDGYLDKDAYQYRSIPVDRKGDHVWKHDLFNMVGKTSVNVVKAGQSDVVEFSFKIPHWVNGPLSISSQVKYRKLNTRYAKWALQEDYQTLPITDVSRAQLLVPVREQKEAFTVL